MQKKDKEVVIPFFGGLVFPLEKVVQNFRDFFLLVSGFSFLSTILSMLLGRGFACGIDETLFFCGNNIWSVAINLLLLFLFVALFIRRWWLVSFTNEALSEVFRTKFDKRDLKIIGFLFMFFFVFAILCGGVYVLYVRKVTPHFNFELAWFVFISFFIIAALFVLANAVVFARFLDGKKWFVLGKTALPVFDNIYKLMGWFLCYLLFLAYLVRQVDGVFVFCRHVLPMFAASFIADFVLYFVFYFMITLIALLLKYQEMYIFADEEN